MEPHRRAVATLNPEAGWHAAPTDPQELASAQRAGDRSLALYPYYEWRYGERGRRFGHSDSAWLITVSAAPESVVLQEVRWLGVLLASRGMPQLLLERHLELLHQELASLPDGGARYGRLLDGAEALRLARLAHVPEPAFHAVAETFEQRVGAEWRRERRGLGELLVAAVADERQGIARAVPALTEWLTDPTRFSPTWIAAINEAITTARAW